MSDTPKEYWIIGGGFSGYSAMDDEPVDVLEFDPKDPATHVIEYSAYEELKKRNQWLEDRFDHVTIKRVENERDAYKDAIERYQIITGEMESQLIKLGVNFDYQKALERRGR